MIKCPNCGAEFNENESECPYCGYFNYSGAYKEYKGDLKDIKDELQNLGEIPNEVMKEEFKRQGFASWKIFSTITAIILALVVAGYLLVNFMNNMYYPYEEVDPKEQLLWQNENFPILDEYYDSENYEALANFYDDMIMSDSKYSIYTWDHYDFLVVHTSCNYFEVSIKEYESNQEEIDSGSLVIYLLNLFDYERPAYERILSDRDIEVLDEKYRVMKQVIFDELNIGEVELDEIYNECVGEYGVVEYKALEKYVERIRK